MMESASRIEPSPASASSASAASSAVTCFVLGDGLELGEDVVELDGVEAEVLAARADGLRNALGLGGGHHEDDPVGRLFEGLEDGVEGCVGDLVGFVEEVDLVAVAGGANLGLAQMERTSSMPRLEAASISMKSKEWRDSLPLAFRRRRFRGRRAHCRHGSTVGRSGDADFGAAVERHGQDAGDGGFADAAVAGKDVAVGDAVLGEGVGQGAGDVVLAGDVRKTLRTVFSRQYLIAHVRGFSQMDCNSSRETRLRIAGGKRGLTVQARAAFCVHESAHPRCTRQRCALSGRAVFAAGVGYAGDEPFAIDADEVEEIGAAVVDFAVDEKFKGRPDDGEVVVDADEGVVDALFDGLLCRACRRGRRKLRWSSGGLAVAHEDHGGAGDGGGLDGCCVAVGHAVEDAVDGGEDGVFFWRCGERAGMRQNGCDQGCGESREEDRACGVMAEDCIRYAPGACGWIGASCQAEVRDLTALRLPRFFAALRASALRRGFLRWSTWSRGSLEAPQ